MTHKINTVTELRELANADPLAEITDANGVQWFKSPEGWRDRIGGNVGNPVLPALAHKATHDG